MKTVKVASSSDDPAAGFCKIEAELMAEAGGSTGYQHDFVVKLVPWLKVSWELCCHWLVNRIGINSLRQRGGNVTYFGTSNMLQTSYLLYIILDYSRNFNKWKLGQNPKKQPFVQTTLVVLKTIWRNLKWIKVGWRKTIVQCKKISNTKTNIAAKK